MAEQNAFQRFMTPDMSRNIGSVGLALSQLDQGRAVDLSAAIADKQRRAEEENMRSQLTGSGLLDQFTPEQRQMLSMMPPAAAQQLIADTVFAAPKAPTAGISVGGNLVNPITGEVIYQAPAEAGFQVIPPEEVAALGLPPGAYQRSPEGKITQVGGSGQNITVNTGDESRQFGEAPTGTAFVYDETGEHQMEPAPGGGFRPKTVPLGGTEAEERVSDAEQAADKSAGQAQVMLDTIDSIIADPGLDSAVGVTGMLTGALGPLSALAPESSRARSRIEQLQGQVFLDAFESLKGGGQITEVEGQKAEAARARLSTAQSPEDFRDALTELRQLVETASQRPQGWSTQTDTSQMSDDDLLQQYLGGN